MSATTNQCPKCGAIVPSDAPQSLCPKCVLAEAATTEAHAPPTATAEIPSLERVAAAFPQLEIVELIGRGGMGFVFKARQPHLDRFVALKLLPDKLAGDPHFAERFNREGRFLARLNHPNIVSVFDFGQAGGFYFLMMEFVDGVNLRQAMRAGKFSATEALSIVPKICEALQYAHEQGVLHRDIKPENILLDAKGRVKIADFGIAKLVGEDKPSVTLTGTGTALGTPHYMAPEQLEKPGDVDHRADIYSLGVVFYEMLTGELPIGRFKAPSARTPLDTRIDEIVLRALERERDLRQKNATEFKTQVEHVASTPSFPPPPLNAPSGPHDTVVVPPKTPPLLNAAPRYSHKAIWSAALVGFSLLIPAGVVTMLVLRLGAIGWAEIALVLGLSLVPALVGTILGWAALSEIRARQGAMVGLPLAVFGALAWPILALVGAAVPLPGYMLLGGEGDRPSTAAFLLLVLAVPVGVFAFCVWAIHAVTRWAAGKHSHSRRGVLRWVFLALVGLGVAVAFIAVAFMKLTLVRSTAPAAPEFVEDHFNDRTWIRFTITSVDIREELDKRWLAFDYVEHVNGNCQRTIRNETDVPGFTPKVRVTSFRATYEDSPDVVHHRAEFLLPPALSLEDAHKLRDDLRNQPKGMQVFAEPEADVLLFRAPVGDAGTFGARIGAKANSQ